MQTQVKDTLSSVGEGLNFEKVWASLMELRESQKETARQIEETARQMKETDRKMEETARQMKETDRQMKETDRKIGSLGLFPVRCTLLSDFT